VSEQPTGDLPGNDAASGVRQTSQTIIQSLQQLIASANVRSAFGEPQTVGNRTVIPVAEVACGFGFGMGSGDGPSGSEGKEGSGAGGGGGGGARTRAVAVIVVEPEGVIIRPVVDVTQIMMAAVTASVFTMLWMRRMGRKAAWLRHGGGPPSPEKVAMLLRNQ
jgi:uncharacterized spore protein YtfJ